MFVTTTIDTNKNTLTVTIDDIGEMDESITDLKKDQVEELIKALQETLDRHKDTE